MKNLGTLIFILIAALIIIAPSCKEKVDNYLEEQKKLEKYLADSNITTLPDQYGLYYIEKVKGTGEKARSPYTVSVKYRGTFLDGTVFDSNMDSLKPLSFPLGVGAVIDGWEIGLTKYMYVGGKAKLIIPSTLAYGPQGSGPIPGYTTLVFDIELVNLQ